MLPFPVLTIVPDFTDPPVYGIANVVQRAGLAPAQDVAFFPQTEPDRTFSHKFTLTTAAQCRALKAFFLDRGGRLAPFYLPSWRADLPAISGTSGENLVTVSAEDYAADFLDGGTYADNYGRQIFIWQPGETLFTAAVVAATESTPGETVLNIAALLPFDIDPATAIVGFLHLATFEGEDLDFDHLTSAAAAVHIQFRSCRQWSGEVVTLAIEGTAVGPYLPFATAAVAIEECVPFDSRIAWGLDLAAWLNPDGIRKKTDATPYNLAIPDGTGTISALSPGIVDSAHLSLSIDADGSPVFAYQISETQFTVATDETDPVYFTFDGIDPVLASNYIIDGSVAGGDQTNAVFYRKPADNNLYARLSPGYGTETAIATFPLRPLKLKRAYADGRFLKIEYMDAHFRRVTITSEEYPAA